MPDEILASPDPVRPMAADPAVAPAGNGVRRRLPWGLLAVAVVLLLLSTGRLPAAEETVYPMLFPVAGEHTLTDSFGDPRGRNRSHEGVDILADRMTPVVAVAAGTVRWVHDTRGGRCCDVAIVHDDAWRSRYIHLNNDTPGTDDGRAVGIAPGVREGGRVAAGQVIGWVGDSGNAESTVPHLHFELRRPDGTPVDPLPSLQAALQRGQELVPGGRTRGGRAAGGGTGNGDSRQGGAADGDPREGEEGGGIWRRLLGGPDGEGREAPPAPPMPPNEGEPDEGEPDGEEPDGEEPDGEEPDEGNSAEPGATAGESGGQATSAAPGDPGAAGHEREAPNALGDPVPAATPRPGALDGLFMDGRRVERLPAPQAPPAGDAARRPGGDPSPSTGGGLTCFGFAGR